MTDRTAQLNETLSALHAQQLGTHPLKNADRSPMGWLDVYLIGTRLVLVQFLYTGRNNPPSWDVFVPVSDDASIPATLESLRAWATPNAPSDNDAGRTRMGNTPEDEEEQ